ncbi:MAG: hypothetical protein ACLSBH_17215 [Coprobacillus cateniformis]
MKAMMCYLKRGFEELEALSVVDVLRRADVKCDMLGMDQYGSYKFTWC